MDDRDRWQESATQSAGAVEDTTAFLQMNKTPPYEQVSWYDIKQSHGKAPVMLELWGMQSTPSLPSFQGPLWVGVVAPDRVPFIGQIELFDI